MLKKVSFEEKTLNGFEKIYSSSDLNLISIWTINIFREQSKNKFKVEI